MGCCSKRVKVNGDERYPGRGVARIGCGVSACMMSAARLEERLLPGEEGLLSASGPRSDD